MMKIGNKIAERRKDLGLTQLEFADKMNVTRQTVSRWENGAIMPDIDKIADIATLLNVSCDYLLRDDLAETEHANNPALIDMPSETGLDSHLLESIQGKKVQFNFFDEESDVELYNAVCTVLELHGNWLKISAETKKGQKECLLPVSSVCSIEIMEVE